MGQFLDGFSACFSRQPQREAASQYLDGLFNDSERKSMQAMHGRLSDPGQYQALQHFITHSPWDAARVWTQLRAVVPVRTGILALDDTGFPKQGTHSVGVQRQYCGALGKIGNCQVAVSSALIADGRTWPLAFDLYLPVSWTDGCAAPRGRGHSGDAAVSREVAHRAGAGARRSCRRASRSPASWSMPTTAANAAFRAGLGAPRPLAMASRFAARRRVAVAGVPGTQSATRHRGSRPPRTRGSP